jgi:glycosyltransferase involved in cell wall biosynthesis
MKISVDGYNISLAQGTGVATYGRTLISAATALGHDVGVLYGKHAGRANVALLNEIAVADNSENPKKRRWVGKRLYEGSRTLFSGFYPHSAYEVPFSGQVILPPAQRLDAAYRWNIRSLYRRAIDVNRATGINTVVNINGLDLAHWTYPLPIAAKGACNIYTLHDLVPLRLPYTTTDHKRAYYRLCMHIAKQADHIITVSEASRRDIIEILNVPENRVTNIYQSVDVSSFLENIDDEMVNTYVKGLIGINFKEYFLFFGAIEPKKNVSRLIEAYLSSSTTTPLVIVSAPGWGGESDTKLLKSLKSLDNQSKIIWLQYLPRDMLMMLIAGARATLFPSLYEGFGLPVAESMALGTPVITSNVSSLPEVAGNAAILVDPYDTSAIAGAIRQIDADSDLRAELSRKGTEQAAIYSPSAYKELLKSIYDRYL